MDNLNKFKVTVVYGTEACSYANEHTTKGAIRAINSGKVEGDYRTYEMDTEKDFRTLLDALEDSAEWGDYFYSEVKVL